MEIIGEAQVFAEKSELGTDTLEKLLELNFGNLMHSTSTRMTKGVYLPGEGMIITSVGNTVLQLLMMSFRRIPLVQFEARHQGCPAWCHFRPRRGDEVEGC
jgi:hypothetical protein